MVLPDLKSNFEALDEHWRRLQSFPMGKLFENDSNRFQSMSLRLDDIVFDYSKNRLDKEALTELFKLAVDASLEEKRQAMFAGEKINITEQRAVLHTALRNRKYETLFVDGTDILPGIKAVLEEMSKFSSDIRSGEYKPSGVPITNIVNIGIGGSDLGPKMVTRALSAFIDGPAVHYVSNVDGADIQDTLDGLDPHSTLFIVASKTFTTQETMTNAKSAFHWMNSAVGGNAANHFCAISTNLEATKAFGIPQDRTFGFWDWVGGRFSVWSAIGLSVMIAVGPDRFYEFLSGAAAADEHFLEAGFEANIPVVMALVGIWHRNICGFPAIAVLPYDNRLEYFPAWLQQLDMESNGKSVGIDNKPVSVATAPIVFGAAGTNGQHAFYQLLHQGTDPVPCDFLVASKRSDSEYDSHHNILFSNCLAQSEALMLGRDLEEAGNDPQRVFEGNRPSNTFMYKNLDPFTLGALMAFYEHKIFVQGVIWGINTFDQWGVELGKKLSNELEPQVLKGEAPPSANSSTSGLIVTGSEFRKP